MSKRFGRNQKRSMQYQIEFNAKTAANLSEALLLEQGLKVHLREKLDEANEILADVARILGRNFAGLKPEVREIAEQQREYPYLMHPPLGDVSAVDWRTEEVPKLVSQKLYELEHVYPQIVRDRISEGVHIHLQTPDGRKSYAISHSAWFQMRMDRRRMVKELAPMIADELARFMAGGER